MCGGEGEHSGVFSETKYVVSPLHGVHIDGVENVVVDDFVTVTPQFGSRMFCLETTGGVSISDTHDSYSDSEERVGATTALTGG